MINPTNFWKRIISQTSSFVTGVPDSLLKEALSALDDVDTKHIIASNEGAAIGHASGYHLATNKIPIVYLQNSGLGNTINPLLSLCGSKAYDIPMLLIIGWRGSPYKSDAEQHLQQGECTLDQLKLIGVTPYTLTPDSDWENVVDTCISKIKHEKSRAALVVSPGCFEKHSHKSATPHTTPLTRSEAIKQILDHQKKEDLLISSTGKISREVLLADPDTRAFLNAGSMGHTNAIALGIALNTPKRVICIEGDGSCIMHMGSLSVIAKNSPKNLIHIILDNECHESVGGQPTASNISNLAGIAKSAGYKTATECDTAEELDRLLQTRLETEGPHFVVVKINTTPTENLPRPKSLTAVKNRFMEAFD